MACSEMEVTMSHLYKRKGGQAWYVKYYENGNPKYRSLKTTSKKRAQAMQREIDRRLDAGIIAVPEKGKDADIDAFWTKYSQWAKDHKRPSTIALEDMFWRQFMEYSRVRHLSEITRSKIENFKQARLASGVSRQTVNNTLKTLQAIVNHAQKLGFYDGDNPFVGVERYSIPNGVPKFLTPEQIIKVMEAARDDSRDAHIYFALGIFAGMRKAEIDHARWEWFDFDSKLITLQSSESFVLKDKDARTIPLSDDLAAILEPHRQESGYLIKPDKQPGKYIRYRYDARKMFSRVKNRAGLSWLTPHILRHTFGSTLAAAGVSIYKIQKWMGHSSVATTQVYAHLQDYDADINVLGRTLTHNGVNGSTD